jgi:hypothetical protein
MEAAVIDAGSSLLKAGFAIPDQTPAMVITSLSILILISRKQQCVFLIFDVCVCLGLDNS